LTFDRSVRSVTHHHFTSPTQIEVGQLPCCDGKQRGAS
jgi:hypothetical protein